MPIYIAHLVREFENHGGRIFEREIDGVDEAFEVADIVVNCSGLGAKRLVGDDKIQAKRGQLIKASRPASVDTTFIYDDHPDGDLHVMVHSNHIMLGGIYEDANLNANLTPDMSVAAAIYKRCVEAVPALKDVQVLEHLVGLRPARRDGIRLERQTDDGKMLIHNYGHGGVGGTFSWGCADEVVRLINGEQ